MRKIALLIVSGLFSVFVIGQEANSSYEIKADSVIFQFDANFLEDILNDENSIFHDFVKTDFQQLISSKAYETWSENGWVIQKISEHEFQLRKCLDDFIPFNWDDKYLVPSENWRFPRSLPLENDQEGVNERIAEVASDGNADFTLSGFSRADKVILTGSFNNWDEDAIKMVKNDTGWTTKMRLSPGIYEYKFIVDGQWHHDNSNPLKLTNEHQTLNSILLVGKEVQFNLKGYHDIKNVVLSGSFNNWNEDAMQMNKTENGWNLSVPLPPGKHYYKFKIRRDWILDKDNPLEQKDERGNTNSVLIIN